MLPRVPLPLRALCGSALLLGIMWALVTPPFQAPDEHAHFAYAEYLARTGHLPGDPSLPPFSTEQFEAGLASNSDQVAGNLSAKMSWAPQDWHDWQQRDERIADAKKEDAGGQVPSSANPPLYYAIEALPAALTQNDNLFTRLTWERLFSMLWSVALVAFAWLLAGEVFARNRPLQFVTAAVAGLLPMVQFLTASVTPDAMLYAIWTAVLWRGTALLKRGLTPLSTGVFLALVGAACVVKATSYALLPGALLVLAIGVWRLRGAGSKTLLRLAAAAAGLVVTLGAWFFIANQSNRSAAAQVTDATSTGAFHLHDFLSYLYQYYFPRIFGMGEYPFPPYVDGTPFYDIVLRGVFGLYGWTEVRLPQALYTLLSAAFVALGVFCVYILVRRWRSVDKPVFAFFALTLAALMAGLQWTDYNKLKESNFLVGFNQGRYLLPLVALGGLAVATAIKVAPARIKGGAIALTVAALVTLNALSMGVVLWRFYA